MPKLPILVVLRRHKKEKGKRLLKDEDPLLQIYFGLSNAPLEWIRSFLSDRTY